MTKPQAPRIAGAPWNPPVNSESKPAMPLIMGILNVNPDSFSDGGDRFGKGTFKP